jgi:glycosyltransferase involved in cell wall biosynthesis
VAAVLVKKKLKLQAKIIATLHYNLPYQLCILPYPQSVWIKYLNRRHISQADDIVAVSKGVAEGFRRTVKRLKPEVKVIYNPVFDDSIYEKSRQEIEEDYFNRSKISLINIARLEGQKNHRLLIEAMELLRHREDIQLLIIGKGALEEELKKIVDSKKMNEKIHFLGFKPNPFSYLARSDLFVLSSAYEGLPTVLIESLALGINIVSTDCPSGPDEILEHGKYGWLVAVNDPGLLASAIEKALASKHPSSFLQERALLFHKKNIIPQYLKLID